MDNSLEESMKLTKDISLQCLSWWQE